MTAPIFIFAFFAFALFVTLHKCVNSKIEFARMLPAGITTDAKIVSVVVPVTDEATPELASKFPSPSTSNAAAGPTPDNVTGMPSSCRVNCSPGGMNAGALAVSHATRPMADTVSRTMMAVAYGPNVWLLAELVARATGKLAAPEMIFAV